MYDALITKCNEKAYIVGGSVYGICVETKSNAVRARILHELTGRVLRVCGIIGGHWVRARSMCDTVL